MRRLDRYLITTVVGGTAVALLIILSLSLVFEFIDETRHVGEGSYSFVKALIYVMLITPQRAYEAFPVATLIGALVGLGTLATRHELVAMRSAGVSVFGIARAVVLAGLLLAVSAAIVGEWLAPKSQRMADQLRANARQGPLSSAGSGGFWIRDGKRFVHVSRAPRSTVIEGVSVYTVRDGTLESILRAQRGRYEDGAWRLRGVETVSFGAERITRTEQSRHTLTGDITPAMLDIVVVEPRTLAIVDLVAYIRYLNRNGLDDAPYRLAFWLKLATPLATVTMLVLTVPLVFGLLRRTGVGQQVFIGVLIGLAFFLANRLLANAGLIYGLPPALSALAPTLVFLAAGVWGLTRVR